MPITHVDPAGGIVAADGADQTVLRPRDWKAKHTGPGVMLFSLMPGSWVVPVSKTEVGNSTTLFRMKVTFQYIAEVRFVVNLKIAGKGELRVEYSSDNGATWGSLDGAGGPVCSLIRYGTIDSGWKTVGATLKTFTNAGADVILRLVGITGQLGLTQKFGMVFVYGR